MNKKISRRLLQHSCDWIRQHWDAQNLDVPDELLAAWIFQDDEEDPKPRGFHLAVFTYGFLQRELVVTGQPPGAKRAMPVAVIFDRFERWQLKLALAEVHRKTDLQVDPMPLFGFPEKEDVRYWPRNPEAPASK
jgi:hypothetical protein